MPELSWTTRREGDLTLVELTVENDADGPRRVRVESIVPVWPPRRRGVPVEGWDGDAVELRLGGDERRGVGYASPEFAERPAELAWSRRPDDAPAFEPAADVPDPEMTPAGVERAFEAPGPPADAVPLPAADSGPGGSDAGPPDRTDGDPPESVASWLADVTDRVERVEALAAAGSLPEATEAVAAAGGIDGAVATSAHVREEAEALRAVASRAAELADRADAADPRIATLHRLV